MGRVGVPGRDIGDRGTSTVTVSSGAVSFAGDKTITLGFSDSTATLADDYTVGATALTLSAGTTSVTTTITAVSDTVDEDGETILITAMLDDAQIGVQQTITITDDDPEPGLTLSPATQSVDEEAGSATFTVALDAASGREVRVHYATADGSAVSGSGNDYTEASGTLTFSAGDESKTLTVAILDDSVDEADEDFTLALSNSVNATVTAGTATVTITDTEAVSWDVSASPAAISETGGTSTVTVSSGAVSFPGDKTITLGFSDSTATLADDYTVGATALTLSAGTTSVTTTITAVSDTVDEDDETILVTAMLDDAQIGVQQTVTITDDDPEPGLTLGPATQSVDEEAGSATFTVTLDAASGREVRVDYATADGSAVSGSGNDYTEASGTLTFSAEDESKTLTVAILDDSVDEADEDFTLALSNAVNATVTTGTATVTITDGAVPGAPGDFTATASGRTRIVLAWTAPTHTGGAVITGYRIEWSAEGGAPWTELVASHPETGHTDRGLEPGTTRHYRVSAVNAEGAAGPPSEPDSATTSSLDALTAWFVGLPESHSAARFSFDVVFDEVIDIAEADFRDHALEVTGGSVKRAWALDGLADIWRVRLKPDDAHTAVTIALAADRDCAVTGAICTDDGRRLTTALEATVAGKRVAGKRVVTLALHPPAIDEAGGTSTVTSTVTPASAQGFTVEVSAAVSPAVADVFTLSENTTLSFAANATESTGVVTITAVDNDVDAPDRAVTVSGSVAEGTEVAAPGDVTLSLLDDDTRGVTVEPTALTVAEGGSGSYTVVLDTEPTAEVTVSVAGAAGDVSASPTELTFTTSNWSAAQTVTVSVAEDDDALTDAAVTLTHTAASMDSDYDGATFDEVTVTITDNDAAGVTVEPTALTVAEGGSGSYAVVLDTEPAADVVVSVAGVSGTDLSLSATELTYTTSNWSTEQTVTVTAGEDDDTAADAVTLTHTAASMDSDYDGATFDEVTVTITDNDTAGVTVEPTALTVAEGGSGSYAVVLDTEPAADVVVSVAGVSGTDLSLSATELTYTTSNWSTEQTVTVTAGEDDDSADDTVTLTHTAASMDSDYDGATFDEVTVTITDNDTAGVTVEPTALTVAEGGSGSYAVVLNTEPAADVVVSVAGASGRT